MKAVVAAFNHEKALVGAFSVITNLRMELFQALMFTDIGGGGGRADRRTKTLSILQAGVRRSHGEHNHNLVLDTLTLLLAEN